MTGRWERVREWLLDHLPAGLLSRPDEALIAWLCIMSGFGAAGGKVDVGSIEALLPEIVYRGWGLVLLLGGIALAVGIASIRRAASGYLVKQAAVYRLGQRLLFTGGIAYAACVLTVAGAPAFVAVILFFSMARGIRLLTIGGRHGHD